MHSFKRGKENRRSAVSEDINVLALVKGEERYIFLFDDAHRSQALRVLGRYASTPDLSFSWYDAAVMSQKIRKQTQAPEPHNRLCLTQPTEPTDSDDLTT